MAGDARHQLKFPAGLSKRLLGTPPGKVFLGKILIVQRDLIESPPELTV